MGCIHSDPGGRYTKTNKNKAKPKTSNPEFPCIHETYELTEELGKGAFSVVRKGKNKITGQTVAVKCINRDKLPEEDEKSLKQEVQILRELDHKNIVKCYELFEEPEAYYMVMEYMEGGELFDRIVQKTFYSERDARDLVTALLSAIKYCHDHNIVHRDLKPENLLLASNNDDSDIKLADFGFAVRSNQHTLKTQCGTPNYVAPEILNNEVYDKPVDMWSIGVITFILLGGYPPFDDDNQQKLFKKIKKADFEFHPEYWVAVSDEAKDLIKNLLRVNPNHRLTAAQAMQHAWIHIDAGELEGRSLDTSLATLKKYTATRKLRAAVRVVIASNRMSAIMSSLRKGKEHEHEHGENSPQEDSIGIDMDSPSPSLPVSPQNEEEEIEITTVEEVEGDEDTTSTTIRKVEMSGPPSSSSPPMK